MEIYTSYFYQLRFFKPYMIPLSTACSDPMWYHNGTRDKGVVFQDKRGVINGLRILPLVPDDTCSNLCRGKDNCEGADPESCAFLHNYYKQLQNINFDDFMSNLESHVSKVCAVTGINREPIIVIMVHEALTNPCSERVIIQRWFADNGIKVEELTPSEH